MTNWLLSTYFDPPFLSFIVPVVNSSSPSPTPSNNSRRVDNRTQTVWVGQYENDRRGDLACWLLGGWNGNLKTTTIRSTEAELPGYDGWYNNLDKPDMGAIGEFLLNVIHDNHLIISSRWSSPAEMASCLRGRDV